MMEIAVLSWNLFHGRDAPPDRGLFTWRSRLFRVTERNATHAQVNRPLLDEFAALIAAAGWDVGLLQEAPPAWAPELARRCRAEPHRVLTSRNQLAPLRQALGRLNPDLIASGEGGSNFTLVRPPWRIAERRVLLLNPFPRRGLRERRRMAFTTVETAGGARTAICVANLHATAGDRAQAEADVRRAAEAAVAWSRGRPLLFGGDLNLRPATSPIFAELDQRFGLREPAGPQGDAIDHLLALGLEVVEAPLRQPVERRELRAAGDGAPRLRLRLRLSDHAPLTARYRLPPPAVL